MATKDNKGLKKFDKANKDEGNLCLIPNTKNNSNETVQSSYSLPLKSYSSGDEDKVKTKKDLHSWNKSNTTLEMGSFGKVEIEDKKEKKALRPWLASQVSDDDAPEVARNSRSSTSNKKNATSASTITSIASDVAVGCSLKPIILNKNSMDTMILSSKNRPNNDFNNIELSIMCVDQDEAKEGVIFFNQINIPDVTLQHIQTSLGSIFAMMDVKPNGMAEILDFLRDGDMLLQVKIGGKAIKLDVAVNPIRECILNSGEILILRMKDNKQLNELKAFIKVSSQSSSADKHSITMPAISQGSQHASVPPAPLENAISSVPSTPKHNVQEDITSVAIPGPQESTPPPPTQSKLGTIGRQIMSGLRRAKAAASCKPRTRAIGAPPPSTPPQ